MRDEISFSAPPGDAVAFVLDRGLSVESLDAAYEIEEAANVGIGDHALHEGQDAADGVGEALSAGPVRAWRLRPRGAVWSGRVSVPLHIRGVVDHPPQVESGEYARAFSRTPGIIDAAGVYLSGASHWLPDIGRGLVTFDLGVTVPADWHVISQGRRLSVGEENKRRHVRWRCDDPMPEVYLVGGPLIEYQRRDGGTTRYVFLRRPDASLAARYLDAAESYLEMYSDLIGRYPYPKFALVENFWETGYGMPSFTLLGSTVIRLPFILHSSYPHEILHNWWGNSVYVDESTGNWSEGLTAYLADHLVKEGRGRGAEYRRDTLARYRSYVRDNADFPLSRFHERHSPVTEAVGYGKSLMLWHMLRRRLGDARFVRALRELYAGKRFERVSFRDIAAVFSRVSGENLRPLFDQWTTRVGAPELAVHCRTLAGGRVRLRIEQKQNAPPFRFTVPVALTLEGTRAARIVEITVDDRVVERDIDVDRPVLRVDLDPQYDVFRRLAEGEVPPTVADMFGSEHVTFVLPVASDSGEAEGWTELADRWGRQAGRGATVVREDEISALPDRGAVWIFGPRNRWGRSLREWFEQRGAWIEPGRVVGVAGGRFPLEDHSFVLVGRRSSRGPVAWVGGGPPAGLQKVAGKLPHYGRYSYVVFAGAAAGNVAKGRWQAVGSPLTQPCGGDALEKRELPERAALPRREPLARPRRSFDPERLSRHVRFLAADELEGRGVGSRGLDRAARYIADAFRAAGLDPGGPASSYFDDWNESGGPGGREVRLRNVIGVLRGTRPQWREQSVVVGAHYDHLGRGWPQVRAGHAGEIHNGADDNASGVAVLLELARFLAARGRPERTIVFVAFSGEEWERKGSRHYLETMTRWPAQKIVAMVNLDTVGRLGAGPLLVLGTDSAREWPHIVMGVQYTIGVAARAVASDPGGSDHSSFRRLGIPAVQLFTGAHADYHLPSDDVEKIDAEGLAKVASFAAETLSYLASREDRLTTSNAKNTTAGQNSAAGGLAGRRRASLGTLPDYTYPGPGVRVSDVAAGSPAERAGIEAGDIVVAVAGKDVNDLRSLAAALAEHGPGERVTVTIERNGERIDLQATLAAR